MLGLVYREAGTTATKYLYASGLLVARIEGTTTSYVHQDAHGSTRAVTDSAGGVAWATQYKPFGIEYGATGSDSKLRFTGQQKDANTGLYYLFRRFYDPEVGRFLGQDRILGHLTVLQSLVRYAYTVNNPLRYVDPTGEFFFNPQLWGAAWQGFSDAVHGAAAAVGDWWASSSIWDKLDMAMTIVGFIPRPRRHQRRVLPRPGDRRRDPGPRIVGRRRDERGVPPPAGGGRGGGRQAHQEVRERGGHRGGRREIGEQGREERGRDEGGREGGRRRARPAGS
jgi:RHS repeat-associated protein